MSYYPDDHVDIDGDDPTDEHIYEAAMAVRRGGSVSGRWASTIVGAIQGWGPNNEADYERVRSVLFAEGRGSGDAGRG